MAIAPVSDSCPRSVVTKQILQVGRSDFITTALQKLPAELSVVSSAELPETILADIRNCMIIFVPSKTPSAEGYERFGAWFERAARQICSSVQVVLVSSLICEVAESKDPRYKAYRAAKIRLENEYARARAFSGHIAKQRACILRLGMFMQGSVISRPRAIWILAGLLRPFASSKHNYYYTNASAIERSLSSIFQEGRRGTSRAAVTVPGLDIFPAPQFLRPALQKIYVADEFDASHVHRGSGV